MRGDNPLLPLFFIYTFMKGKIMKKTFIAVAEKSSDGYFAVKVPDVRGSYTQGTTIEEAQENISEALQEFVDVMANDGDEIPEPTCYEELIKEYPSPRYIPLFVPVFLKDKRARYNIMFDEGIMNEIDKQSSNRSAWLEDAAKAYLSRNNI